MLACSGATLTERRLLLFGGSGRLGSALQAEAGEGWTVVAPGRGDLDLSTAELHDLQLWIKASAPQVVLNAAAMASVDACEDEPAAAERINARFPGRLARACALEVIPLVHISTDYVFGDEPLGGPAPYSESRPICPLQSYGRSKAQGEEQVQAAGGVASVVRISWLTEPGEDAFVRYLLSQVRTGSKEISVLREQMSRPTVTGSLARWLLQLVALLSRGVIAPRILHPSGCEPVSRGQWAEEILAALGHEALDVIDDPEQVHGPSHTVQGAEQRARRPLDSSLDSQLTLRWSREHGLPLLEDWRTALAEHVGRTKP